MTLRKSDLALAYLGITALLLIAAFLHAAAAPRSRAVAVSADLTARLGLSDLALFTEARYTRHPSQADLHTPFQDHPMSFDHFPTGSLIGPPASYGPTGGFAPAGQEGAQ